MDILAYGEPMVEFNQTSEGGGRLYLQGFGGDSSNFAIAAARQGARAGYWSALGDDANGRSLRALWDAEGVDHRCVQSDAAAFTAIYFVTHGERGHEFHFYRSGSAASRVSPADVPHEALVSAKDSTCRASRWRSRPRPAMLATPPSTRRARPACRSPSTPTCGSS